GTAETASAMARAALIQFKNIDVKVERFKNVREEFQLLPLLKMANERQALIIHTMTSPHLRDVVESFSKEQKILTVDLLGPVMSAVSLHLNKSVVYTPGLLRSVNETYFKRIDAIEYTVKHDDGKTYNALNEADIILVGISRTSKTPLSIFLSHKGWKVANVPLVLDTPLPEELFKVDQRKVIGLMIDGENLYKIRRKRLEKYGQDPGGEYASKLYIEKEIQYAESVYKKNKKWPVFNVTERALEETASEIIKLIASRMNLPYESYL
ncbi:MAG: kinase/pyrophosphorylase, partial [Bdellovibrionales bacterium]|nr:kinase/pyrophosphorylase [Bdellovibrionales bacterium]